jgi:hypothetical protein
MNWNVCSTLKKTGLITAAALLAASGMASAAQVGAGPCVVGPSGPIPPGCTYLTPDQIHAQGLQDQINLSAQHQGFTNVTTRPGGDLLGEIETFDSVLVLHFEGINKLKGVSVTLNVPAHCETHIGPRDARADFQSFDTEMYDLQGSLTGDPNFASIKVVAGNANGLSSPGHTTLTRQKNGTFLVSSNFRMNFQIELVGAKGSPFEGVNLKTEGIAAVQAFANP